MKKGLLFAVIAVLTFFTANAQALELNQYVSAKGAWVKMQNDAYVSSVYSFGGVTQYYNTPLNNEHSDDVFGLRLAYGLSAPIKFGALRTEIELGWNDKAKDGSVNDFTIKTPVPYKATTETSVYSLMLNFYYDIDTGTKFTPYLGAGIGVARVENEFSIPAFGNTSKDIECNFAWQVGAGVAYALTDSLSLDLGYRYSDYGTLKDTDKMDFPKLKASVKGDGKYDMTSHEISFGIRYTF